MLILANIYPVIYLRARVRMCVKNMRSVHVSATVNINNSGPSCQPKISTKIEQINQHFSICMFCFLVSLVNHSVIGKTN